MNLKIKKDSILPFIAFFLIVLGNGAYISSVFGNKVEYFGLVLLIFMCIWPIRKLKHLQYISILIYVVILSIGAFTFDNSNSTKLSIVLTAIVLVILMTSSGEIISTKNKISIMINAILCGTITTILIGAVTGTLGIGHNLTEGIFIAGFPIKNYCGGIWMLLFVLSYIVYEHKNKLRSKKSFFTLLIYFIFAILSGSKGAVLLCVVFLLCVNYNNILHLRGTQKTVSVFVIVIFSIFAGIYIYNNILINVRTYAYRMKGLENLLDYILDDSKRFLFGISDIAYEDTGRTYAQNLRSFLGWEASVEMAYVNIIIKYGVLGFVPFFFIYKKYFSLARKSVEADKQIIVALIVVMMISGLVETYAVSIHYIVGPVFYCLINGLLYQNQMKKLPSFWREE